MDDPKKRLATALYAVAAAILVALFVAEAVIEIGGYREGIVAGQGGEPVGH